MTDAERIEFREAMDLAKELKEEKRRREALVEGARVMKDVAISSEAKEYVMDNVLREAVPMKDNAVDTVKLAESINSELRRFGSAIGAGPRVTGMGVPSQVVEITEAQRKAQADQMAAEEQVYTEAWAELLDERPDAAGKYRLAEAAQRGRVN